MEGETILVISPHADDATIYCGGYIQLAVRKNKRVVVVRVTDDDQDGVEPTVEQNVLTNRKECEEAYSILGASETVHLGYHSDFLMNVDFYELRERFIRLLRRYRPAETLCFGLDGRGEENPDHIVVATAFSDAVWAAGFTLHCPEQIAEGLTPYLVPKRISYYRNPADINLPVDISEVMQVKIKALRAQSNVMSNMLAQIRLKAACMGITSELFDAPQDTLVEMLITVQSQEWGRSFSLACAELFKLETDSIMGVLQKML